jgi:hypothetical protein
MATTAPRGISAAGVVSRITINSGVISGILQEFSGFGERGRTVTRRRLSSQAGGWDQNGSNPMFQFALFNG